MYKGKKNTKEEEGPINILRYRRMKYGNGMGELILMEKHKRLLSEEREKNG